MVTFGLLRLLAVMLLVAVNAFFVAAEFALVSVRDTRVQQLIDARRVGARTVQKLQKNLDHVLPAIQFGVTLASLALGWLGEPTLAQMIQPALDGLPHSQVYAHTLAITLSFATITVLHVIMGEVVPKSLAFQRSERVALAVAAPMDFFMTISRPALYLMTRMSAVVLRAFGSREAREGGVHTPEELSLIVTASGHTGMLPQVQVEMVQNALEMGNVTVREVMVPRPNIFSLPSNMQLEEAMARVVEEQHSRVPVYDEAKGPEHIIGLLYSKDLSRLMYSRLRQARTDVGERRAHLDANLRSLIVRQVMREVLVVPETKLLTDLLQEFKKRKRHLAVVVDEFGSTSGVISVEDVLEQLVGELEDEFDVAEPPPLAVGEGVVIVEGADNIRDLEAHHQVVLPRDSGFETMAGFVMSRLGKVPRGGESFVHDGRKFTVLQMDGHRVLKVKVEPNRAMPASDSGDRKVK